tara:strand:+ start:1016 stop:1942 length:927 start_codon:yes stop_codon:yes gene_type:complete
MTYKEVLDDLIDIMSRHYMIQSWGYGNLSDLVSPFKRTNATDPDTGIVYNIDYPYAFLQPTNHNLQTNVSRYNFNLIMMEQCNDEPMDVIQAQSNCHQYIKDILAEIYYNYGLKYDFTLNSSVTPFKEKYNDTVSGMTANISLEIRDGLNDCIAPFAPKPGTVPGTLLFEWTNTTNKDLVPGAANFYFSYSTMVVDPNSYWQENFYIDSTLPVGSYKLVMSQDVTLAAGGSWLPEQPVLLQADPAYTVIFPTTASGWPLTNTPGTYTYNAEYFFDIVLGEPPQLELISVSGGDAFVYNAGGTIKLYTA